MKTKITLIIIIISALLVRTYQPDYPPLLWDEASLGYNAYSILKTARDEYGSFLPVVFKSFGDYKPGLYVYLTLPFVWILGLNELSVRLPSVLVGSFLPLIFFLISRQLTKKTGLALLVATITAFNPYNIHFSRGAWESNILLFEISVAIYFIIKHQYTLSATFLASTLYTYQSGKLLSLLLLPLFLYTSRAQLYRFAKYFLLPLFIFTIPISFRFLTTSDSNRLQVFSIFSYPRPVTETQTIIDESTTINYQLFHNQFVYFSHAFFERYFNYFSPRFLFNDGDWQNPRHGPPYVGVLLYPSLLFFLIGVLNYHPRLLTYLLIVSPIPAALSRDSVSAVRALPLTLPLCFFTALGIYFLYTKIKSHPLRISFSIAIFLTYLLSFLYYQDLYFHHMVKRNPQEWLDGYKQAVLSLNLDSPKQPLVFTPFFGQPYIYYLFYHRYPPAQYQASSQLTSHGLDVGSVDQLERLSFSTPDFNQLRLTSNFLAIFSYDDALRQNIDFSQFKPIHSISPIDNFYLYER